MFPWMPGPTCSPRHHHSPGIFLIFSSRWRRSTVAQKFFPVPFLERRRVLEHTPISCTSFFLNKPKSVGFITFSEKIEMFWPSSFSVKAQVLFPYFAFIFVKSFWTFSSSDLPGKDASHVSESFFNFLQSRNHL